MTQTLTLTLTLTRDDLELRQKPLLKRCMQKVRPANPSVPNPNPNRALQP